MVELKGCAAMGACVKMNIWIFLTLVFLAGGCANRQDLAAEIMKARKAGTAGVTRVYPVDTNQAWDIAMAVFRWEKTDKVDEHRDENYVITSTGMEMALYGSVLGVWIEPADATASRITVITKRRAEGERFTRLDAETFYRRFDQGMKFLKEGKKLPFAAPLEKGRLTGDKS